MQYVRSISGSVSKTWNSINPATLSGAIDVVVVEQEDGSLACSPFHIRFGKFSLLRPSEKKVEFKVNGEKVDFPMKLGEGGEAFFVFETRDNVPAALQTSPLVSPATSPDLKPGPLAPPALQEPDPFQLDQQGTPNSDNSPRQRGHSRSTTEGISTPFHSQRAQSEVVRLSPLSHSPLKDPPSRRLSEQILPFPDHLMPKLERAPSDSVLPAARAAIETAIESSEPLPLATSDTTASPLSRDAARDETPAPIDQHEAKLRAMSLSKKLWTSNISNQVTESGDLMLDMTGFKDGNMEALQAEGIARQLLSEEIDGPYDIGALIGADEKGNIWIYSSEEAKAAAGKKAADGLGSYNPAAFASTDALSDPGYHSDDARSDAKSEFAHHRRDSDSAVGASTAPNSPEAMATAGNPNKNYAKTLRLTSDQLKTMSLRSGANSMAFTVNRATCNAVLWYWKHDVPIVISDIDGTITKSDVLGHVLYNIGRDWTHQGVAKLYTDIASNGYNFLYLTSRSVGQADTTRTYLDGVVQEGFRLPKGPVILSPDRTIAALRREIYLRKPEIFKMACLRDIMALFSGHGGVSHTTESVEHGLHVPISNTNQPGAVGAGRGKAGSPFYAGFGNRLTDALSYRSVNIPSTRIFTINSNSEVSLDLLSLNKYKTAYSTMREIVDHYFPPVGLLVKGGGEDFTDFNYWREQPLDIADFTDSEDEDDAPIAKAVKKISNRNVAPSVLSEDEAADDMMDSYLSDPGLSLQGTISATLRDGYVDEDIDDNGEYEDDVDEDDDGADESEYEVGHDDEADGNLGREPTTPMLQPVQSNGSAADERDDDDPTTKAVDQDTGLGLSTLTLSTAKLR